MTFWRQWGKKKAFEDILIKQNIVWAIKKKKSTLMVFRARSRKINTFLFDVEF